MQAVAQKVFTWRLRLLPYHYSAFYDAHTFGCPVMRPMFLSFPGDAAALPLDQQLVLLLAASLASQGACLQGFKLHATGLQRAAWVACSAALIRPGHGAGQAGHWLRALTHPEHCEYL